MLQIDVIGLVYFICLRQLFFKTLWYCKKNNERTNIFIKLYLFVFVQQHIKAGNKLNMTDYKSIKNKNEQKTHWLFIQKLDQYKDKKIQTSSFIYTLSCIFWTVLKILYCTKFTNETKNVQTLLLKGLNSRFIPNFLATFKIWTERLIIP